jgi:hypothetical protein
MKEIIIKFMSAILFILFIKKPYLIKPARCRPPCTRLIPTIFPARTAAPSTPPGRNAALTTPSTPTRTITARTVPLTTGPLTTAVPGDVVRICGILDGYADALTTALSIVYNADDRVGAAIDIIL